MNLTVRPLRKSDDPIIAKIIRDTLAEFGANHPGTVYFDPTTDILSTVFQAKGSMYNIVELDGSIAGGGGIFPTEGLPDDTCELVKMYLLPHARGIGLGKLMIEKCIGQAKELGYKNIYLETMPELQLALKTYAHFGFTYLNGPMGNSGHTGCSLWMIKRL
ncbi:MAG TPA: GNAT family N-acetyltransferase [Chitinophagaceae bacterium]